MLRFESYLKKQIDAALAQLSFPPTDLRFERPRHESHGDISVNLAMTLTRELKRPPREIAGAVVDALELDEQIIGKTEIAGPGFINFFIAGPALQNRVGEILAEGGEYGKSDINVQRRALVEFVSANPTGPLTVGHGRQAVLGDTIANLLQATGYHVEREYYFNNAGRQMRVLGDSVRLRYEELTGRVGEFPEDHYQGEYIKEIALALYREHEGSLSTPANDDLFKDAAEDAIFADIKATLQRLGIVFDRFFNESDLYSSGAIDAVVNTFREKNLAYEQDGALWFRSTQFGLDEDRVIIKSSGEPTYRLPDMAYHKNKLERGYDLVVDLFGSDHVATYPDVMAGLQALGLDASRVRVLIHQFVTLFEGEEMVKMSTRKANYITVDELLAQVGPDAARWFFLMRSMQSHLNFDIELARKQSDENPVYYNQYAHARICSILRKAAREKIAYQKADQFTLLNHDAELALIKKLCELPKMVLLCGLEFEPHLLLQYMSEVSTAFHRFYTDCRVIEPEQPDLTQARLGLCIATRTVLANGFKLAGVAAPERM